VVELAACCAGISAWLLFGGASARARISRLFERESALRHGLWESLTRPLVARFERHRERRRDRRRWRGAVIELCDGMASELAAGRTPDEAFAITAALLHPHIAMQLLNSEPERFRTRAPSTSVRKTANEAVGAGAGTEQNDIPMPGPLPITGSPLPFAMTTERTPIDRPPTTEHLEKVAQRPGAEGLRLLAASWRIGAERGGTLASVLDDLATALRDQETTRQEIATQLAGPRATARLLAVLPLFGLFAATLLGADPVAFLVGTVPGLACLLVGLGLNATGLWWTHRLAKNAEELV
jgi:tight adherence protein B